MSLPDQSNSDDYSVLDAYIRLPPSGENAIRLFDGEWSSKLPPPYDECTGHAELFDDHRITWMLNLLGGVSGYSILELGPLEAGHTFMLENAGAASVLSIESNSRAFMKCLIVKESLELKASTFLLGDFTAYLRANARTFDLCVASGILYHLQDPLETLRLISNASDQILLWTHYYDKEIISSNPELSAKFTGVDSIAVDGVKFSQYHYEYGAALDWQGFCGGPANFSHWLSRADILSYLRQLGYTNLEIGFDDPDHPNGPSFAVLARRKSI